MNTILQAVNTVQQYETAVQPLPEVLYTRDTQAIFWNNHHPAAQTVNDAAGGEIVLSIVILAPGN